MAKLGLNTVMAVLAMAAVSGCVSKSEVHERLASPDGKYEAVVMTCPQPSDRSESVLVGAVFDKKGLGCDQFSIEGLSYFMSTIAPDVDGTGVNVSWAEDKAIFDLEGERYLYSRGAQSNAAIDMIQLKGSFDGADIPDEE